MIYVDGCSFTYGLGLDRKFSIGQQLNADLDLSRPGKSNTAIVTDLFENINKFDTFIIGFTFADRYTFYHNNTPLDINPNKEHLDRLVGHVEGAEFERNFPLIKKFIYSFTDTNKMDTLSDFYLAATLELLKNKKYAIYSMQPRNVNGNYFLVPGLPSLPDGHFNDIGMTELANLIRKRL